MTISTNKHQYVDPVCQMKVDQKQQGTTFCISL